VTPTPLRPDAPLDAVWAIVPLRGLETAKTRLGGALDPEERAALVVAMATRTLEATRDAASVRGTVLVTADPAAAALARGLDARTLVQRLPGLNAAIREARGEAIAGGATAVLVLPIDLPAISAAAVDELIAGAGAATEGHGPLVAIVPDQHGRGTNALLVAPAAAIDPAFGEGSRERHRAAALAAGARFLELGGPLGLDLDTSDDLLAAESIGRPAGSVRG
jgi:2-phospho-L-lactate guanylyltransferase